MASTTSTRRVAGRALALGTLLLAGCASTPPAAPAFGAPLPVIDVSSEFGERRGVRRRPHFGVDLRAPRGTPVAAVADGEVVFRGNKRGYGKLIMLEHAGEFVTYYAHLKGFAVASGARVVRGQTIGFVGRTGNASGPHLHLELREGGEPVDPRRRIPL